MKHALIQETAYQSLLKRTRQQYHQRIAQVLEQQFPDIVDTQPELLAHHYTEAGRPVDAMPYWQQAGDRANAHSAHVEALSHVARGLEVLATLPETPEHTHYAIALHNTRALALVVTARLASPAVEDAYARTYELCQQLGEPPQLFSAVFGLCRLYSVRSEFQKALGFAEQLIALAQRQHDPARLPAAHWLMGANLLWCGEGRLARTHLEQGIALCPLQPYHSLASLCGQDPGVMNRLFAALILWWLGYPDQAVQRSDEALALARQITHPYSEASALVFTAWLHQLRREYRTVYEWAEAAMALSTEQGFPFWTTHGTFWRGWAQAQQGHWQAGIVQMQQSLDERRLTRADASRSFQIAELAKAYGHTGQIETAFTLLAEALSFTDQTGERFYEAELHRLRGALWLAQSVGYRQDAETCFHNASVAFFSICVSRPVGNYVVPYRGLASTSTTPSPCRAKPLSPWRVPPEVDTPLDDRQRAMKASPHPLSFDQHCLVALNCLYSLYSVPRGYQASLHGYLLFSEHGVRAVAHSLRDR